MVASPLRSLLSSPVGDRISEVPLYPVSLGVHKDMKLYVCDKESHVDVT